MSKIQLRAIVFTIIAIIISIPIIAKDRSAGVAVNVDKHIFVDNILLEISDLVLEYNGNLYVSAHDVATNLNFFDVKWDEKTRTAMLYQTPKKNPAVKSKESALAIGKAVAKTLYADKISERTSYNIVEDKTDSQFYGMSYKVNIYFDGVNSITSSSAYADVIVSIKADTGEIGFDKKINPSSAAESIQMRKRE